jgi:D-amino peptidase
MRIFIVTDLEGVAGVLDSETWCHSDSRYYEPAKDLLTREVNAAVEGFVAGGADDVLICDGHGCGAINAAILHPAARVDRNWQEGKIYPVHLDPDFAGIAWIGQHPKAGTVGGHLCHTGTFAVRDLAINGLSVGEFGQMALCAGELGVPVILACGCEAFCREARQLAPGIEVAAVKRGTQTEPGRHLPAQAYQKHNTGAIHLSPEEARRRIRAASQRAVERLRTEKFPLVTLKPPFEQVIVFRSDELNPPRVCCKRHDRSVADMLNRPWELQPLTACDPMQLMPPHSNPAPK